MQPDETPSDSVDLADISELANRIEELRLVAYEPDIYLARVRLAGTWYRVTEGEGHLYSRRSQLALKKPLKNLGITRTTLVHVTAYDEMIGNPPAAGHGEPIRLANPDDDYS